MIFYRYLNVDFRMNHITLKIIYSDVRGFMVFIYLLV